MRRETFKIARKEEWPSPEDPRDKLSPAFLARSYYRIRVVLFYGEKTETTDSSSVIKRIAGIIMGEEGRGKQLITNISKETETRRPAKRNN